MLHKNAQDIISMLKIVSRLSFVIKGLKSRDIKIKFNASFSIESSISPKQAMNQYLP